MQNCVKNWQFYHQSWILHFRLNFETFAQTKDKKEFQFTFYEHVFAYWQVGWDIYNFSTCLTDFYWSEIEWKDRGEFPLICFSNWRNKLMYCKLHNDCCYGYKLELEKPYISLKTALGPITTMCRLTKLQSRGIMFPSFISTATLYSKTSSLCFPFFMVFLPFFV